MTCKALDIDIAWRGTGIEETSIDSKTGTTIVKINLEFYRPSEVALLIGNTEKTKADLGWQANTTLEELCAMMVDADLRRVEKGAYF